MNVLAELEKIGAIYTGRHFIFVSGKHAPEYINLDVMFPHTVLVGELCKSLVAPYEGEFDVIVAPATGGIVLAVLSAYVSGKNGVWADKDGNGGFEFERAGFSNQVKGKRVLIVEDLLSTGSSVVKVRDEVEKVGGTVVGISVVCNRGGVTAEQLGVPKLSALANINLKAYEPEDCELCAKSTPIVEDIGHGDDYKKDHPDYAGGYVKLQEEL